MNSLILDDFNIWSTVITMYTACFNIKEHRISAQSVFVLYDFENKQQSFIYIVLSHVND
jgi:hypothetical protein